MIGTFWALVPAVVAIALALITKEVYSSLFAGIVIGGLFFSGFSFSGTVTHVVNDGFLTVLSDSYNIGILIFLVALGIVVCLMNDAGGSSAFARWAKTHIKTKTGAQLATIFLGALIFIDDYFNCLTVGSVMLPVADKHQISRSKLAYLIDATAAPICIIAPISSWAAAVSGFVPDMNGLTLFIKAIPYNYYALLTILFMIGIVILKIEFGPMAKDELAMFEGKMDSVINTDNNAGNADEDDKGLVIDLVFPIIALIIACVIGMIASGGFFGGENFVNAFANCDASVGLSMGSLCALVVIVIYYICRRVLSLGQAMACVPEGFKSMVPAILILSFAWTLKAMTDSLGAREYVAGIVQNNAGSFAILLPAVIFIIGALLAFSTGTSWGTFGILIPIVVSVFQGTDETMLIISISACMAGAVCGDHCSPISDTTIMASAGAKCDHVRHVATQMPYAICVATVSFVSYIVAGIVRNCVVSLIIAVILLICVLAVIKVINSKGND